LVPLPVENVTATALEALQASEARANKRVGANSGEQMPNQAMRTAEGVQAFTSGLQVKMQYFIETFADLVFIPAIERLIILCKENLKPSDINRILVDAEGAEFQGSILDVYNGTFDIDILPATKLAARKGLAALVPMMMNMFGQPAFPQLLGVQAKKVNMAQFFQTIFDITGWPDTDLIVDMTPEDQQRAMMNNPAVVKAQTDAQAKQQDQQNTLEQISAKGQVQVAGKVIQHALKETSAQNAEQKSVAALAKPLATQGQ
jgi:hypothetical protein